MGRIVVRGTFKVWRWPMGVLENRQIENWASGIIA
jgi:hypothetical protein